MSQLKRSLGLGALFVYGIGDILGAGIYALIGKVAHEAGEFTWLSFAIAMVTALLTALSYAELTRRFPHSGGASYFVQAATKHKASAFLVGWLMLSVSIVSMATLSRAAVGYLQGFNIGLATGVAIGIFLGLLTLINLWGIRQSSWSNMIGTAVEVSGLIVVVIAGFYFFSGSEAAETKETLPLEPLGILQGAALAFYAFIGFEDLANIAEEVEKPRHNLPIAIVGSLVVAGLFYVLIGWISTQVLSPADLSKAPNPLTEIVAQSGLDFPLKLFGVIALFAVANTCLLNFVTGSRLLYGMAEQKIVPNLFQRVSKRFQTPFVAILSIVPVVFGLALVGELRFLAGTTSVLILLVFCSSNYALIRVKKKGEHGTGFRVPIIIPWLALLTNFGLIAFSDVKSLITAGAIIVLGLAIYAALYFFNSRQAEAR